MTPEEFTKQLYENADGDYGIFPPPTEAQHGLDILIEHFLGKDYHHYLSMHVTQVNSEAIHEILKRYPKREKRYTLVEYIKSLRKK